MKTLKYTKYLPFFALLYPFDLLAGTSFEERMAQGVSMAIQHGPGVQSLITWVIAPLWVYSMFRELFFNISMNGDKREYAKTIFFGFFSLMLIGIVNTPPQIGTIIERISGGQEGAISKTLSRDGALAPQILRASQGLFERVAQGTEFSSDALGDSFERGILVVSVGITAKHLCGTKTTEEDMKNCTRELMSLDNDSIRERLTGLCEVKNSRFDPTGGGVSFLGCIVSNGIVVPILIVSVLVPLLSIILAGVVYFIQISMLVTISFTLVLSNLVFALFPNTKYRDHCWKTLRYIVALGAFMFLVNFFSTVGAALIDVPVSIFGETIITGSWMEILTGAIQTGVLVSGITTLIFLLILRIPDLVKKLSEEGIPAIGGMVSDAAQLAVLAGGAMVSYVAPGVTGFITGALSSKGAGSSSGHSSGAGPVNASFSGGNSPQGIGGGFSKNHNPQEGFVGATSPGGAVNYSHGGGYGGIPNEEESQEKKGVNAKMKPPIGGGVKQSTRDKLENYGKGNLDDKEESSLEKIGRVNAKQDRSRKILGGAVGVGGSMTSLFGKAMIGDTQGVIGDIKGIGLKSAEVSSKVLKDTSYATGEWAGGTGVAQKIKKRTVDRMGVSNHRFNQYLGFIQREEETKRELAEVLKFFGMGNEHVKRKSKEVLLEIEGGVKKLKEKWGGIDDEVFKKEPQNTGASGYWVKNPKKEEAHNIYQRGLENKKRAELLFRRLERLRKITERV